MKKLICLIVLTVLCLAFTVSGCETGETPSFIKSDNKIGEGYVVNKTYSVKIDEGINFDGVLDEEIWQQSKATTFSSNESYLANEERSKYGPTSISIKAYFTDDNLYLGIDVEDKVIYGPNVALYMESSLELDICSPTASIYDSKQLRLCASGISKISYRNDNHDSKDNYLLTTGINLGEAVVIHGEGLNTDNNTGYTIECVVSWKDLGFSRCPEVIAINPKLIRVYNIPSVAGGQSYLWDDFVSDYTELDGGNPRTWWRFDKDGAIETNTLDYNSIIKNGGIIDGENIVTIEGDKVSLVLDDANEKRGFDVGAKLSKHGLYVEAEVRSNNIPKFLKLEFFEHYWKQGSEGRAERKIATDGKSGEKPTWKEINTEEIPEEDILATGYKYKITYKLFFSWNYLMYNLDITNCPGYNANNPENSTVYINPAVMFDEIGYENEKVDPINATYYKFENNALSKVSGVMNRWRMLNDFSAISADSILY
ncbi:MAG: hypothetical protein KBS91_00080, partial [Firmicutes bacterium]|nr:hypothetical protein [Candidatus Caballimonas caccae]